ncbi:KdsC family phosphatase [Desulfobacca acetoxidans]|uniref:3-deoxy-D-manno-octulosonate 8-phosphate phosphatase KdsC n=1 Tax=Desulfobacca acetoxidans (strain ATCC 700848 / DSM 11109 / ASRB2) TaxID=880072 RepID=F2NJX9_DESAR|nr:HAD-IIIA family hydrolase [Desulfobacca acetoxidans]AEB09923.1 3-deoxy-D-manno-octulosonate 8-phosphate phosphatase, YrbI family [Desulfobacca acetoxidans DSM 11109]
MNVAPGDMSQEIWRRAALIKLLALDVDGVLTDGSIIYTDAGEEIKCFHVRDGHGIRLVQQAGIEVALITGRTSAAVAHRARNLHIAQVYQGIRDKVGVLTSLQATLGITPEETAVVGDDLVDLALMRQAGLAVAVADAANEVKERAHWVTSLPGGRGAVREVCETLLKARGIWEDLFQRYWVE